MSKQTPPSPCCLGVALGDHFLKPMTGLARVNPLRDRHASRLNSRGSGSSSRCYHHSLRIGMKTKLICWFSLVAFVITLGPDLSWLLTTDRAAPSDNGDSSLILRYKPVRSQLTAKVEDFLSPPLPRRPSRLNNTLGLKIFVYELPPQYNEIWTVDPRCSRHLFAAEVAIHQILLSSPVRTLEPELADFFFVPVYVSCNFSNRTGFPSLGHAPALLRSSINLIKSRFPYWNRTQGRDHIFTATHDFGACFHTMEDLATAAGIPKFLQNSIILQTFGRTDAHPCQAVDHIQIPPYVPATAIRQVWLPPHQSVRNIWAYFRGKIELHPETGNGRVYSRGVRTLLWKRFRRNRKFRIRRQRSDHYLEEIQRSTFCLCPLGWAPWSPRIVESVALGCVPVIIADNIALPFSSSINWSQIALFVPEMDVPKLGKILERVSRTNLTRIQSNLWKEENRRTLLYSGEPGDASWHILQQLASRKLALSTHR